MPTRLRDRCSKHRERWRAANKFTTFICARARYRTPELVRAAYFLWSGAWSAVSCFDQATKMHSLRPSYFFHKKRSFLVLGSQLPAQLDRNDGNQPCMECYPSIWSEDQNAFFEAKLIFWQIAFFLGSLASLSCKHILNEITTVLTKAHPQLFPSLLSSSLLLSLLSLCQSP